MSQDASVPVYLSGTWLRMMKAIYIASRTPTVSAVLLQKRLMFPRDHDHVLTSSLALIFLSKVSCLDGPGSLSLRF